MEMQIDTTAFFYNQKIYNCYNKKIVEITEVWNGEVPTTAFYFLLFICNHVWLNLSLDESTTCVTIFSLLHFSRNVCYNMKRWWLFLLLSHFCS